MNDPTRVKPRRKPRSRFHHGDLREAAIEVAVAAVEKHGHAALTLESVATRLGVTRPALYRHFADRRALLNEVGQRGFEGFEASLTEAFLAETDPWSSLVSTGRAYVRYALTHRGWFRLQFSSPLERTTPDVEQTPPRYAIGMFNVLNEAFGHGNPEVGTLYRALWSLVHGLSGLIVEEVWGDLADDQARMRAVDEILRVHVATLQAYAARRSSGAR